MNLNSDTHVNVMIDLETLGTKPGCKILSIGASPFPENDLEHSNKFYITIDSKEDQFGLTEDENTVKWWARQSEEAKKEAFSGTTTLSDALDWFSHYLRELVKTPIVWGNAASFDIKILEAAYLAAKMPVPWGYSNEMCYRTLKNLYSKEVPAPKFTGVHHNALDDAIHQARHAEEIFKYIWYLESQAILFEEVKSKAEREGYSFP